MKFIKEKQKIRGKTIGLSSKIYKELIKNKKFKNFEVFDFVGGD